MRKIYKSRQNKFIFGVCGGIAEYFNIDPVLIRLVFVFAALLNLVVVLFYIIAAIIIPYNYEIDSFEYDLKNNEKKSESDSKSSKTDDEFYNYFK